MMKLSNKNKRSPAQAGMGLIEIIIGSAIILSAILAANTTYTTYTQYALANEKNVQAAYLLEEGVEVTYFLRDKSWTANIASLSPATAYYLNFIGGTWATTTTPVYVDGQFLRKINVALVNRDSNDDIAGAGTNDPNTRKITVSIDYFQGHATTTKSLSTYITNIYNN